MLSGVKKWVQSVFLTKFQDAILSKLPNDGGKTINGAFRILFGVGIVFIAGLDILSAAEIAGIPAAQLGVLVGELMAIYGSFEASRGAYHKVIKSVNK